MAANVHQTTKRREAFPAGAVQLLDGETAYPGGMSSAQWIEALTGEIARCQRMLAGGSHAPRVVIERQIASCRAALAEVDWAEQGALL